MSEDAEVVEPFLGLVHDENDKGLLHVCGKCPEAWMGLDSIDACIDALGYGKTTGERKIGVLDAMRPMVVGPRYDDTLVGVFVSAGLCESRSDYMRVARQGGRIQVDGVAVLDPRHALSRYSDDWLTILQIGNRSGAIVTAPAMAFVRAFFEPARKWDLPILAEATMEGA